MAFSGKKAKRTTCYELYSNAHRGKMWKERDDSSYQPIINDEVFFVPSRAWAEIIRKVNKVDPLVCLTCGGQMRVIAFTENHKAVDMLTALLKLTF